MDNRGNNRDSDFDRSGSNGRRGTNDRDRDERHEPSSNNSQAHRIDEEEEMSSYRSQIAPRSINITSNRVGGPTSTSNMVIDRFYSYGFGSGVPMKPGGKSAAVVAIQ